eukprot:jgi/Mesen1/2099/ME000151S01359
MILGYERDPLGAVLKKVCLSRALSSRMPVQSLHVDKVSMPVIQRLYDACKTAFQEGSPSPEALQKVRQILDKVKPSDVGLVATQEERGFGYFGMNGRKGRHSAIVPKWAPPITYLHLHECDKFSMGIFCIPTGAAIPLHNHPGMTVLSKLVYGSMHVKAFDWVELDEVDPPQVRRAKLVEDGVLTAPCATEVLYPSSGGNIHAFTAVMPCAVLDVLAPPYDLVKGRTCTYYREVPSPASSLQNGDGEIGEFHKTNTNQETLYLETYNPPDDFVVQRGHYKGQNIVVSKR